MSGKWRKVWEAALAVGIIALSVAIFLFREELENIGQVGYLGLFALCFLANATVLLPAPSLMIAASCALIMNPLVVAVVAALGSALGEFVGYLLGNTGRDLSPKFGKLLDWLNERVKNPFALVFLLAALPLPLFDVVGVYSGGTKLHLGKFFAMCFLGKLVKMLVYTRIYDLLDWAVGYLGMEQFLS